MSGFFSTGFYGASGALGGACAGFGAGLGTGSGAGAFFLGAGFSSEDSQDSFFCYFALVLGMDFYAFATYGSSGL